MENIRETILLVDDNITNLNTAKINLSEKYNIVTATSGEKTPRTGRGVLLLIETF